MFLGNVKVNKRLVSLRSRIKMSPGINSTGVGSPTYLLGGLVILCCITSDSLMSSDISFLHRL